MFSCYICAERVCLSVCQEDKDTSSTKESLDDLFPTEDEEQSQSKTAHSETQDKK